jgi:DNA-binding MarR family transcriptional regulator
MGLTRQSVHATVARLIRDGLVELVPNEDHRRSAFVGLTEAGLSRYRAIDRRQAAWANGLAREIARSDLDTAARVLDELGRRLESDGATGAGR